MKKSGALKYMVPILLGTASVFYLAACNSGSSEGPTAANSLSGGSLAVHEITANYAYIPNHGEASVSKVDLLDPANAVARYYTAPRLGDMTDLEGNPSAVANDVDPFGWRTSRIAMDAEGNAWVLNTAGDFHKEEPPTSQVGSVVRIQADITGLDTNADHANPYFFGTDEAVQVFPVGADGEIPRAIAIDGNGYIWIGFYSAGYFQKYEYDPVGPSLAAVGDPVNGVDFDFAPYDALIDSNGTLWFSSRNSTPARPEADLGVYSFDTTAPVVVQHADFQPYALLLDEARETVWCSIYDNVTPNLYAFPINPPGSPVGHTVGANANQLRGMTLDGDGNLWLASSNNQSIIQYLPETTTTGKTYTTEKVRPVGVGMDAAGYIWAIMRDDNVPFGNPIDPNGGFIEQFDPAATMPILQRGLVQVGILPYAYGDFTREEDDELCPFDDTAWAYGEGQATANNDVPGNNSNAWGWTNYFTGGETFPVVLDLYAGAGQNDISKGTLVGTVEVGYAGGCVTVTYAIDTTLETDYVITEAHLWIGYTQLPLDRRGNPTASPGQFPYSPEIAADGLTATFQLCDVDAPFYVSAHAVVEWMDVCEEEELM